MNRLKADFVLLIVALIWGSAFAVQRVAAHYFDAFTFNGLRFILAGLILFPFSKMNPLTQTFRSNMGMGLETKESSLLFLGDRKSIFFIILAGGILFGAAGLQQVGLESTTAGNAGFITTLYVVLVPMILWIFFKENIHWLAWVSAGIAIIGSLLLTTGGTLHLSHGDAFELAGSILWACHLILVSRAVKQIDVMTFSAGQYIVAGLLNLFVSVVMQSTFKGITSGWWTVVYIGFISTSIGYTLQVFGQKYAPPTDATILLSMEAIFAALTGFIFLGETMRMIQLAGCGLILVAVFVTQYHTVRSRASARGINT